MKKLLLVNTVCVCSVLMFGDVRSLDPKYKVKSWSNPTTAAKIAKSASQSYKVKSYESDKSVQNVAADEVSHVNTDSASVTKPTAYKVKSYGSDGAVKIVDLDNSTVSINTNQINEQKVCGIKDSLKKIIDLRSKMSSNEKEISKLLANESSHATASNKKATALNEISGLYYKISLNEDEIVKLLKKVANEKEDPDDRISSLDTVECLYKDISSYENNIKAILKKFS